MINAVKATIGEIVGLFVADWLETGAVLLLLGVLGAVSRQARPEGLGFALAVGVAAVVAWTAIATAKR